VDHTRFLAATTAIKHRGPVVLIDDMSARAATGALVVPAQYADTERIALLVRETSGFICVAMTADRLDQLRLPDQVPSHTRNATGFAVAVDLRCGPTTGISARDRAMTVRALADPTTEPDDLTRPGHVVPVCVAEAGVLDRPRVAEATVDLCEAAGMQPAAAFATVLDAAGEVAYLPELTVLGHRYGFPLLRVSDVVAWRAVRRPIVRDRMFAATPA
jgi:3,4-dihydroxy 2-butanone 4-phosphate synthase/GTP cyclohydrolase II